MSWPWRTAHAPMHRKDFLCRGLCMLRYDGGDLMRTALKPGGSAGGPLSGGPGPDLMGPPVAGAAAAQQELVKPGGSQEGVVGVGQGRGAIGHVIMQVGQLLRPGGT